MSLSTLAAILGAHAKTATAVLAVSAATGGGLAVATTVANSHAAPGLEKAAAAPQASPSASTDSSDSTDSVTTSTDVTPTTTASPVTCDSAKNHGEYVSSVARSTEPGPDHGKAVSEAARSSCGKTTGDDSDTDATESSDTDTDSDADEGGKPTSLPTHPTHPEHSGHPSGH